ncbi:MAG: superoxide dismutase, Ni [Candidatus Thermoplasmatota archaeon]|jgi:nickel superoxide dismutase|nr:superoxide dismutase, Ni [Candidatus Thermoplasmatota archaeon]MCL5984256.1 superoxide dismutase, Ni [Candidatus Thermoplasmatota archaeon]
MTNLVERLFERLLPATPVFAHCDIPCGIYDPHEAQIGALTVLRMVQLANDLAPPGPEGSAEARRDFHAKLARYTATKEAHAEVVKHQVRVIWGDYFTADMVKEFPEVNDLVAKILRDASKARQQFSLEAANALVADVQKFAEIFWKTKKVETKKIPSHQKSGGDLVVPAA